jgi:hypothetical protein
MRTTLTIDDQLAASLKQAAHDSGKTFKQIVNETLRAGLRPQGLAPAGRYRLEPASLGLPRPGIDLDKALDLADTLEDEALARKLEQRK